MGMIFGIGVERQGIDGWAGKEVGMWPSVLPSGEEYLWRHTRARVRGQVINC